MSISPTEQHAIQAKKIMARRANSTNNTTGVQTPAKKATVAPKKTVTPDATAGANPYDGKKRKELRAMCDARNPKVAYVKRDTVEQLIEKLKA